MAKNEPGQVVRSRIDKTTSRTMLTIGAAIAVSVFSLVSAKSLLSQFSYQHQVLHQRRLTLSTLASDKTAANTLISTYDSVFENSNPINIIGGKNDSSSSAMPPDGDNARIVLDSLPATYDYPALISSVSYILSSNGITNPSINGTDQAITANSAPTSQPAPVAIQLSVGGGGSYSQIQNLVHDLERSTRPFDITSVQMAGNSSSMTFNFQMTTYFQPARSFATSTKEVQ